MEVNVFDIVVAVFLAVMVGFGFYRGVFHELVGTVGLIVAAVIANVCSPDLKPYISTAIAGDTVAWVIAWVALFLFALLLMHGVAWLLGKLMSSLSIGWINRLAGGAVGFLKGVLIASLIVFALEFLTAHIGGLHLTGWMKGSHMVPYLQDVMDIVTPWAHDHILPNAVR